MLIVMLWRVLVASQSSSQEIVKSTFLTPAVTILLSLKPL